MWSDYAGGTRKNFARLVALIGLILAGLLPVSVSAGAQSEPGSKEELERAVVEAMGADFGGSERSLASAEEEGRTQVNVRRQNAGETWAFGTAVVEAPKKRGHYPKGWLFVAESAEGGGWNVALEGSPEFSELATEAPEEVVSSGEKSLFSPSRTTSATGPVKTGLGLPWRKDGLWKFTGGPHGWATGYDRPYAALDFAGTTPKDQKVRAAGKGRVYVMCSSRRGWIRIYHPNGYATDYYHLVNNITPGDGSAIRRGAYLGLTGNDVACGGASYGRHVHFALLRGNNHVRVHDKIIGGWKFVQGQPYRGYAQRGTVRRTPGSLIRNFGP